tara:strand:+ start:303 stop:2270 length:1968 start_codon:yes stop_codon:yes gene_type:complete
MADYIPPQAMEYKLGLGRVPEEPQEGVLWRGMSGGEYKNLLEQGFLESKGEYNIGDTQKGLTIFSEDPRKAEMYAHDFAPRDFKALPESSAYVVGIKKPEGAIQQNKSLFSSGRGEFGVRGQIPLENIIKVYRGNVFKPKSDRSGAVLDWQEIAASDFLEPRTTDQSNLPDVISDPSKDPNKSPKSKGSLFRGIGKLAQSRIFPLIQMAQGAYGALSEEQKSEISNFLDKPAYELVGMEKPGLEYFKDLLLGEKPSTEVSETPAENLMKFSPRTTELKLNDVFRSDIPKESWLEEKVKYVKSRGKDPRGFNFTGVDTGNFKDDFIPRIPVSELVKLKGRNKEQENVRKESLASLIEVMGRTGKLPLIGEAFPTNKGQYGADKEYRPFITVDYEGVPTVSEGNHRIMAAAALGMKDLPVEIRYFDGGERKATGVFKPENLIKNSKAAFVDPKSEAKAEVPAEKLMKFSPRTTELSKEALDAFKNVSDTQRGRPELAMVQLQKEGAAYELGNVVEHIGDLTHVLTNEAPHGSFRRERVLGKIAGQINTLDRPDDVINNFLEQGYESAADFSKRDVNEVRETSERLLKQYAEEHKKVPVYNRPQFFAREAAVAVGEKRYSDAVDYLKKLRSIAEDPVEFQQAASAFIKPKLTDVTLKK